MTKQEIESLAKAERNEYAREWRAINKDKVKEANRRYWTKRAENRLAEKCQEADHEK